MQKHQKKKPILLFATGNLHKVKEVKYIIRKYPIPFTYANLKGREIQAEQVDEIAMKSVFQAFQEWKGPIFVEDTGLFIEALNGFPGPYAAYIHKTIGNAGVLKILNGVTNRKATFKSAIAFCAHMINPICFLGEVHGKISIGERGNYGFGFDPIFEPENGHGKTFAEMPIDEKSLHSHRASAVRKFAEWYLHMRLRITNSN